MILGRSRRQECTIGAVGMDGQGYALRGKLRSDSRSDTSKTSVHLASTYLQFLCILTGYPDFIEREMSAVGHCMMVVYSHPLLPFRE